MLVTVDSSQPRRALTLPGPRCVAELWEWRSLFLTLLRRDLGNRYGRKLVGLSWVILQPLSTVGVFTLVFGRIARVEPDGVPYPIFALSGIILWILLRGALSGASMSVLTQRHLVTKAYFPRLLLPLAVIAGRLVDFAIGFVLLLVVLVASGSPPGRTLWMVVPVMAVTMVFVAGLGMATAAANVRYREVGAAVPAVMQFWMYLSPVIYPASLVPERWRGWYDLNPVVGLLEAFRAAVLGQAMDWGALGWAAAASAVIFLCGFSIFRGMEDEFADAL